MYEKAGLLDDYVEGLGDKFRDPDSLKPWERDILSRLDDGKRLLASLDSREEQFSNGESAMQYFDKHFLWNSLFFLDEPENSLDVMYQQQHAERIENQVLNSNGQFIIATHSPFLMAMEGAKVIDLDSCPSVERPWFELPNMVAYHKFFQKYAVLFE